MAVKKPKDFKSFDKFTLNDESFRKLISETLSMPVCDVMDLLSGDDCSKTTSLIEMAVARCSYSAYFDGDVKRLEWLLNKIGITDIISLSENNIDLSDLTNEVIVQALKGK